MENYYDILGIPAEAGTKDVKSAFRRLAKKHHPDTAAAGRRSSTRASEAAMRLILEAYRILSDPERRRIYDRGLRRRAAEEGDVGIEPGHRRPRASHPGREALWDRP